MFSSVVNDEINSLVEFAGAGLESLRLIKRNESVGVAMIYQRGRQVGGTHLPPQPPVHTLHHAPRESSCSRPFTVRPINSSDS